MPLCAPCDDRKGPNQLSGFSVRHWRLDSVQKPLLLFNLCKVHGT
jgi:hypothetical protein